jgi:hypothetical protein
MNLKKIDVKGILQGIYNKVYVKKWIEEVSKERLEICAACDLNSEKAKKKGYVTHRPDIHCTDCGCNLELKTRCMDCACPIKKWEEVISEEEWEKVKEKHKL